EVFDFEQLKIGDTGVRYGDWQAGHLIFAEGWRGKFNPYFQYLPFRGSKGEVLRIRLPEHHFDRIIKHRLFIVPFVDDTYWVGTYNDNQFKDEEPSAKGHDYLRERLDEVLAIPYEIVDHQAAVRPTVKDRRPFLGRHPGHPRLVLFNGLGTKGASLAPFWARHLAAHLENHTPLDPEVDIRRFTPGSVQPV
ncbi:MAG: FAD-dependent oxidoreductase, partial [Lewinella sp.]|nr:FAD-dependent oxidoreductase [Lewinella sp.]